MENQTVYPFGTGGSLPSSIGIVNDLTTGGVDKALAAQQGVVLQGEIEQLNQELSDINGRFYGIFAAASNLPGDATTTGYALVGASAPFAIYNWDGNAWSNSGATATAVAGMSDIAELQDEMVERTTVELMSDYGENIIGEYTPTLGQAYGTVGSQIRFAGSNVFYYIRINSGDAVFVSTTVPAGMRPSSVIQYVDSNNIVTRILGIGLSGGDVFDHKISFQSGEVALYVSGVPASFIVGEGPLVEQTMPVNEVAEELYNDVNSLKDNVDSPAISGEIDVTPYRGTVIATAMNYIVKYGVEDATEKLYFSKDLGLTWQSIVNSIGPIVHAHIFTDGTVMLCSRNGVYYTKDYTSLTAASVYDENGDAFVAEDNSFCAQFIETQDCSPINAQIDDGVEMHVWGDYVLNGDCRIWYTTDYGHTIKCAADCSNWVMDNGTVVDIRHIHRIKYRKGDGWYLNSGDSNNECVFVKGLYDAGNDTWSWKLLAQGQNFKFGGFLFSEQADCIYALSDYTQSQSSNGLFRVAIPNIGDIAKWQKVFALDHCNSKLISDFLGHKVIIPDVDVKNYFYVADKNFDFKRITFSGVTAFLGSIIGPNYNGDIYCTLMTEWTNATCLNSTLGSVNLTQMVRALGIKTFMKDIPL